MSDGACCHYCRRYRCICPDEEEAIIQPGAFAAALRVYMDAQGLTQSEVAKRTGVAQPVIGRLLGTAQPQMPTLLRIARGLGVEIRIGPDGAVTIRE